MGALADQMESLADDILATSRTRSAAIAEARTNTARILSEARDLLAGIAEGRREMGEALSRELRQAASGLTAKVTEFLRDVDRAHAQRTADLSEFLTDKREARAGDLAALTEAFGRTRADILQQVTDGLREFADQVHAESTRLLADARATRSEEFQATRRRVGEALSALRGRVAALAVESAGFLSGCGEAHGDTARHLRDSLSAATEARQEKLRTLLGGFRDSQQKLADDLRASAQAWRGVALARAGLAAPSRPALKPAATAPAKAEQKAPQSEAPKGQTPRRKRRKSSATR